MNKWLFLVFLTIANTANAAPGSSELLYAPTDASQVSISPSGSWIAALMSEHGGLNEFVAFQRKEGRLKPVLKIKNSPDNQAILGDEKTITSYRWISDDDVILYLKGSFTDCKQSSDGIGSFYCVSVPETHYFQSQALVNVAEHKITFSQGLDIVKSSWGDNAHILAAANVDGGTCLMLKDLHTLLGQQCISEPLRSAVYVAASEAGVYARVRDKDGVSQEYQLDIPSHKWLPAPMGTFQMKQEQVSSRYIPSSEISDRVLKLNFGKGAYIYTPMDSNIVGYSASAPHRSFTSLDPRLDTLQELLERRYPEYRAGVHQVTDDLQHALIEVWKEGVPVRYVFFDAPDSFNEYSEFSSKVSSGDLGSVHIEHSWGNNPIAITMPPTGTPLIGAIVVPFTTESDNEEKQLHQYRGYYQIFAKNGIAVIQVLLPIPDLKGSNSAGANWRTVASTTLKNVIDHVSKELLNGASVCLYGTQIDASLSLALGTLPRVACVIAENPLLNTKMFSSSVPLEGIGMSPWKEYTLKREVPAVFGANGEDVPLTEPLRWISALPKNVMLVFNLNNKLHSFYADNASEFREALKKSNKHVIYYAPQPVRQILQRKYAVDLGDNMAEFAVGYFKSAGAFQQ